MKLTHPAPIARSGSAPAAPLKIAAVSSNPDTLATLRELAGSGAHGIVLDLWPKDATHWSAQLEQSHPDLLFIEPNGPPDAALDALAEVLTGHPGLTPVLVSPQATPEVLLRALRCGVREVVPPPLSGETLAGLIATWRSRRPARAPQRQGKVLAMMPCKGGAGATVLAGNLAACLAAEGKRTCLIDLNFYFGEAALYVCDQAPNATVADVLQQVQRLDGPLLEASMLRVAPDFWLLPAAESLEDGLDIRPEAIERLLQVARRHFDFVVLDVNRMLDANLIRALDQCDGIYLVLQASLPFLRDAARLLKLFRSLDYAESRLHLIVNRYEKQSDIDLKQIAQTLGHPVAQVVPSSFALVLRAINQGRPLHEESAGDPVTQAVQALARRLAQVAPPSGGWFARWWKRPTAAPLAATDLTLETR